MTRKLVWIANTYDPKKPDTDTFLIAMRGETQSQAAELHRQWLADKVIGEPQSAQADSPSPSELKAMGLVGVYKWVEES